MRGHDHDRDRKTLSSTMNYTLANGLAKDLMIANRRKKNGTRGNKRKGKKQMNSSGTTKNDKVKGKEVEDKHVETIEQLSFLIAQQQDKNRVEELEKQVESKMVKDE